MKILGALLALTASLAPSSAADKPPLRIGTMNIYTVEQQQHEPFAGCVTSHGFSPSVTLEERKRWTAERREEYTTMYWSCFHRFLEGHPAQVTHDTYCRIDGTLRPREDCAQP